MVWPALPIDSSGSFYAPYRLCFSRLGPAGLPARPPGPQTLQVDYDISLAGLPLGTADLSSTFDGRNTRWRRREAVRPCQDADGRQRRGDGLRAHLGRKAATAAFAVTSRSSSDQRTVRMGLTGGNVAAVEIDAAARGEGGPGPA